MKKILVLALALMVVTSMFVGCTPGEVTETTAAKTTETTAGTTAADTEEVTTEAASTEDAKTWDAPAEGEMTMGLVTDVGGIDDKSFNQGTWEGVVKYAEENGLVEGDNYKFVQSTQEADYVPNLSVFADDELDIIIAPGFLFTDAMAEVAESYPDQKFMIIDTVVEKPNVVSATFAEHEGSFLVGVAAALKAQEAGKDTVGFLGGMDFGLIQKFEAGFEQGVAAVDSNMKVLIEYAGDFGNAGIGATLAAKMYDEGAYVIYHAAGGTGNGLFKEAKGRVANGEDVWAIGVDKDQYEDGVYEDGKSVVLTSMVKRVDTAAYQVCVEVAAGTFQPGIYEFSLANEGVGLPAENPNMTDEWLAKVAEYKQMIVDGEVEVTTTPVRLQ